MTQTNGYEPEGLVHLPEPINTRWIDGEHFVTRDAQTMYLASNRPGGPSEDADIWISHRIGDEPACVNRKWMAFSQPW